MGKLDRLLSSGEQVLHRSAPAWRPWAWIVALGLGTVLLSAGLKALYEALPSAAEQG